MSSLRDPSREDVNDGASFRRWLERKLTGKHLAEDTLEGWIVLLFEERGQATQRLVIEFDPKRVSVLEHRSGDPSKAKLVVRGRREDFVKYLGAPTKANVEKLALFGDGRLFGVLGEL